MRKFRFNLRTLLASVAVVAVVLGYAQWRRQNILREARALESQGFTLLWQDTWTHWLWPVVPTEAKWEYYEVSGDQWKIGSDVYPAASEDAMNAHYARGVDRLHALGVEYVRLDRNGKPGNIGTSTRRGKQEF